MKFGARFETESVPKWSLHNIDYNSLKHHIKVNTTKDQATAIAIPGRPNAALTKFEDEFYAELCRQHDRVDLFVSSKADEIARRLQHISGQIHRLILRSATAAGQRMPLKRRHRFAKYEETLLQCGDDIRLLRRFVDAQGVAFRKILKKYRKWTGSSALGSRFRENVLSQPKSLTKRDFSHLQAQHDDLLQTLRAALPTSPSSNGAPADAGSQRASRQGAQPSAGDAVAAQEESQAAANYWNEYDYGSEAGDFDRNTDEYAIYIDPNEEHGFPGIKTLGGFFADSVRKASAWIVRRPRSDSSSPDPERASLLSDTTRDPAPYGTARSPADGGYPDRPPGGDNTNSTATAAGTDTDLEDDGSRRDSGSFSRGLTSAEEDDKPFFPPGYSAFYAAEDGYAQRSPADQRVARYRERVLLWGAWACFLVACVLAGIAALLIAAGRHKMRLEVDAGVTLGIITSLGLACAGVSMTESRGPKIGWPGRLAAWAVFAVVCVADGVLLVLVMGDARI